MAELQGSEMIVVFLAGTAGMIIMTAAMAIFILTYQKKLLQNQKKIVQLELEQSQKMIKAQLESQEHERVRIAAELHDSLGSLLYGVKLNANYIERISQPNESTEKVFVEMNNILDQSIETVRRISWELTPQAFRDAGLSDSIQRLCSRLDGKGMTVEFKSNSEVLWNDDDALNVYRIVQELLNNSIKHSGAELITVALNWGMDSLHVHVEDNGKGFELKASRSGVGWWNVNQRANQLNATIHIGVPPMTSGTKVSLIIPLKNGRS